MVDGVLSGAIASLTAALQSLLPDVADPALRPTVQVIPTRIVPTGVGGYIGLSPLVYPTYFGRRYVGSIQGTLTPLVTISSAGGPFLIATVFDLTGSYRGAYIVIMFTWLAAAALMYLARPPKPPTTADTPQGIIISPAPVKA